MNNISIQLTTIHPFQLLLPLLISIPIDNIMQRSVFCRIIKISFVQFRLFDRLSHTCNTDGVTASGKVILL